MKELQKIMDLNACDEAVDYLRTKESFRQAWEDCPRGDWMLWLAKRLNVDIKTLTRAKALCALTVRHLMKDKRSVNACEVALKFSEGKATRKELYAAYAAAAAEAEAAYAAAAAYAYAAAAAAAEAADAADAYADAAAAAAAEAAYAADAYAYADAADAAAYAKKENQLKTADICRELLTKDVLKYFDKFE